jgi:pyruvate/2-oxoglutarate dehydrogenase complex dihydrolipoamide acyltransferase (E2) component
MPGFTTQTFPKSRVATIDICKIGKRKHHIAAFLEINISASREKFKKYRNSNNKVSFSAWLIKVICHTIQNNKEVAAYLEGKRKTVLFNDINASFLVEKEIDGKKVPIPLIIEKANLRSIEDITKQINTSKKELLTEKDIVLQRKSTKTEHFYYILPSLVRQLFWKLLLSNPHRAFKNMGNVAITSLSMMGKINGWFVPISIHPICFGIGSVIKKPVVIDDKIGIGEILNLTVLLDHNVIDGVPMARFIKELTKNIEYGLFL